MIVINFCLKYIFFSFPGSHRMANETQNREKLQFKDETHNFIAELYYECKDRSSDYHENSTGKSFKYPMKQMQMQIIVLFATADLSFYDVAFYLFILRYKLFLEFD
jgi:hypothetical protein